MKYKFKVGDKVIIDLSKRRKDKVDVGVTKEMHGFDKGVFTITRAKLIHGRPVYNLSRWPNDFTWEGPNGFTWEEYWLLPYISLLEL